jgi:hypothetical protein
MAKAIQCQNESDTFPWALPCRSCSTTFSIPQNGEEAASVHQPKAIYSPQPSQCSPTQK